MCRPQGRLADKEEIQEEKTLINKLVANIKKTGAPIVVGLDPMLSYIPERRWRERRKLSGSLTKKSWIRPAI